MKLERFLIISAGGDTRVVHRMPPLGLDEVCYRLNVEIPASWGSVLGGSGNWRAPATTLPPCLP